MRYLLPCLGLGAAIAASAAVALTAAEPRDPEAIYNHQCSWCHAAGEWGTRSLAKRVPAGEAELLKRKDLPPAYTRTVVRRGIGSMPQFAPTELTDAELDALANWLEERN